MEWNPELPKITENINRRNKLDKALDAAVLTPGAMVVGSAGGGVVAQAIPTGLGKETIQPITKATRKALNKAMTHHKMDTNIKVESGRKAFKKQGPVPNARAQVDVKKLEKGIEQAKTIKDLNKVRYLKNQKISLPQGANTAAALHELGHLKHHQRPLRHILSTSTKAIGKPLGAVGAVAGMMHEDTAKYVPVVAPAAMYGSVIGTEAGANLFSAKEIARQKGFKEGLKAVKRLSPYMATYLAAPLAVGGALYGLKKKIHG